MGGCAGRQFRWADTTRFPKVDVQDEEGRANGPGEGEFVVFPSAVLGEDTFGAGFAPFVHVRGDSRPKEAGADAV